MNQFTLSTFIAALLCAFAAGQPLAGQSHEVHRYWKSTTDHFYTRNLEEIGVLHIGMVGKYGYKYESVAFRILPNQEEGTTALYRYWNPEGTDHFYTTNVEEIGVIDVGAVGKHGYKLEGTLGYCFVEATTGTTPLHRYWNGEISDHFYTTDFTELGAGNHVWAYEGIQCYVYAATA